MKKKLILRFIIFIFIIFNSGFLLAGDYSIVISPVFLDEDGELFANASAEYRDMLQNYSVGSVINNNRISPTARYDMKTKAALIATVTKRGMPVQSSEIIWRINSLKSPIINSDCFITNYSRKEKSSLQNNFLKTLTLDEPQNIMVQYPKNAGLNPRGTGKYESLILHPGQSFIELSSISPGYSEISVTLPDEDNPEKNTVYAVIEWLYPEECAVDLFLSDNGPLEYLYGEKEDNICVLNAELKMISGKQFNDILTVTLPESFDFAYDEESEDFGYNFELFKNGKQIKTTDIIEKFVLSSGIVKSADNEKKYVSIKVDNLDSGDELRFSVKTKHMKNYKFENNTDAKILNSSVMLLDYKLIKENPVTLVNNEDVNNPDYYFSNLDLTLTDYDEPVKKGKIIKYELKLLNSGKGKINIKKMTVKSNSGSFPENSKLIVYEKGKKTLNLFGTVSIENYLEKGSPFVLKQRNAEAVLYFELKAENNVDVIKTGVEVEFELLRKFRDGSVKKIESKVIANELTKISNY
ncbi:hypothetical protein KA977_14585 [Candidatus Dependentiae bacterium]|nr:hypothetical protein [Candidatus Dependentiae bacterium]